ncbi:MAG: MerR family transcriptional regulator [Solirubrobacteraceae bacterium]
MTATEHRQELLENILRLRTVARRSPHDEDLAKVRISLERELGEAVSLRLAGRVLGVSHPALLRWVRAGDVPLVYTPAGKRQVPVQWVLSAYEETHADDRPRTRYALAPTFARQREAADKIPRETARSRSQSGHERPRERSLAYHRALARRLRRPMVQEARHTLLRWREQGRMDSRYADEWQRVLALPLSEIRKALVREDQTSDDLRQNSPFAGMLSEAERRRATGAG